MSKVCAEMFHIYLQFIPSSYLWLWSINIHILDIKHCQAPQIDSGRQKKFQCVKIAWKRKWWPKTSAHNSPKKLSLGKSIILYSFQPTHYLLVCTLFSLKSLSILSWEVIHSNK